MKKRALLSLFLASTLLAAPQALHNDTKTGVVAETPVKFGLGQAHFNGNVFNGNFSDLQNKPIFYVKDYGAVGNGTTDDTVAIQAAITAAQAAGGKVMLGSSVYKITDTLVISESMELCGNFVTALYGDRSVFGSDVFPTQSPYLSGSVLLMTTAAKNAIKVTVVGASVNLTDFGIRFADSIKFANTGHGILFDPGAYLTYKNNGVSGGNWRNVYVYGQDGNHYAFYVINAQLITASNLQGYGGGGLAWEVNSAAGWYGNSTLINPYFLTAYAGSAHGYYLHNTISGHGVILMDFVRPQSFFLTNLGNPDPPTGSQYCFYADDDTAYLTVTGADMEGGGAVRLPNVDPSNVSMWTAGHTGSGQIDPILFGKLNIRGGGIAYPNNAAGTLQLSPTDFQDGASLLLFPGLGSGSTTGNAYLTFGSTARTIAARNFVVQDMSLSGTFNRLTVNSSGVNIAGPGTYDGFTYQTLLKNDTTAYNSSPQAGIDFQTKYNSSGAFAGMGGIVVGKENITDGDYGSYLGLFTRPNGGSNTEALHISSLGNISIPKAIALTDPTGDVGNLTSLKWLTLGSTTEGLGLGYSVTDGTAYLQAIKPGVAWKKLQLEGSDVIVNLHGGSVQVSGGSLSVGGSAVLTNGGALGTPSSGVATNLTGTAAGLTAGTASAVAVGGVTGLGTGVGTFLATPSGANLASALTTALPATKGGTGLTALGTGVATAFGVNVGSAGAFVTFNGALGTPSSGTVTNLTGTASININGTVGATTPATGAFTTTTQSGKTTTYNNIATVSNGIPSEVATIDSTGLTANVGASTLYAVPASGAGLYRVSAYLVTTTAASVSSTMPNAQVVYTDSDSNTSVTLDVSPILGAAGLGQSGLLTANAVGTVFSGTVVIYAKLSTTIQYQTVNYASTAAGLTYALRMKLEAL